MIPVLVSLLLMNEAPAPGPGGGFTADSLAALSEPATRPADPAMLNEMAGLREAMILNPPEAFSILTDMEARAFTRSLGSMTGSSAVKISWFFRGAIMRAAPNGSVVGFYNPLVDAWLVTRPQMAFGRWQIADAVLVDGASLRSGAYGYWVQSSGDAIGALAGNHAATVAGFDKVFAGGNLGTRDPKVLETLNQRIEQWLGATMAWRENVTGTAAAERVRVAITEGKTAEIAPKDAASWRGIEIDGLPQRVRATFAVTGAAARGDGHTLFLISPLAPDVVLLLDVAGDKPVNLSVINLANAALSGDAK